MKSCLFMILLLFSLACAQTTGSSPREASENDNAGQRSADKSRADNPGMQLNIALPKAVHATPAPEMKSKDSVLLAILPDSLKEDEFYINGDLIALSNLARRINNLLKDRPPDQRIVYIMSFSRVEYNTIVAALNKIREAGVERIGIVVARDKDLEISSFDIRIAKKVISPPSPKTQAEMPDILFVDVMSPGVGLDQTVQLNKQVIHLTDLARTLEEPLKKQPNQTVVIKAPGDKQYSDVVYVIDEVKAAGAQAIEIQIDHLGDKQQPRQKTAAQLGANPFDNRRQKG
jgi:biopolymer transport protein ExbD